MAAIAGNIHFRLEITTKNPFPKLCQEGKSYCGIARPVVTIRLRFSSKLLGVTLTGVSGRVQAASTALARSLFLFRFSWGRCYGPGVRVSRA